MSDREEMLALANECQFVGSGKTGCNPYQLLCRAAAALRSTARTGPDVADNGILNAAKFVASRDREMLAQMLFALHERHDSPSPIRFNCSWKQLKSFNRASFYKCADDIRAIAAIPAPDTESSSGEEVPVEEFARSLDPVAFTEYEAADSENVAYWIPRMNKARSKALSLLSTFTITRKSKNEEAGS